MSTIKSVKVTKLFGYEGNDFTLNLVDDCQITFVYAFNGVGKTTLLKLIYAVIMQNCKILHSINFDTIIITFNQNEQLIVKRICIEESELTELNQPFLSYELKVPKKLFGYYSYIAEYNIQGVPTKEEGPEFNQFIKNLDTDLFFANKDYARDARDDEEINESADLCSNTDSIPISLAELKELVTSREKKILEDKEKIKEEYLKLRDNYKTEAEKITEKNKKLKKGLFSGLATGAVSSTIAKGVLGSTIGGILGAPFGIGPLLVAAGVVSSSAGLYNRKKRQRKEYKSLEEIVETYEEDESIIHIPLPDKIDYIQTWLKSYLEKDKAIETKLSLFEEIINSYNTLTDKELRINRESGKLEIKSIFSDSKLLEAKYLSSGEKNLLRLYFYIIFRFPDLQSEEKSFVGLIDEPEVSLHPAWLIKFVDSVEHINEVLNRKANYQYIITTHSPGITFKKSDLMVELKRD